MKSLAKNSHSHMNDIKMMRSKLSRVINKLDINMRTILHK